MAPQTPNDRHAGKRTDLTAVIKDREQLIEKFEELLANWKEHMAQMGPNNLPKPAVPTHNSRIQGPIVMLYGSGGYGKSRLLSRYHEMALDKKQQGRMLNIGDIIDWQSSYNPSNFFSSSGGKEMAPVLYYEAIAQELANTLGKKFKDCKNFQHASQFVKKVLRKAKHSVEKEQRNKSLYGGLSDLGFDTITLLIRNYLPVSGPLLDNPVVKNATHEVKEFTRDQLNQLKTNLHDRLIDDWCDYLDPKWRLGQALGEDLRNWAINSPLLIFFDAYEVIDEGDALLRIVMGAAGPRVGWVLADRNNLWDRFGQITPNPALKDSYEGIVSDYSFSVNFNESRFSLDDIIAYFTPIHRQMCEQSSEFANLPPLTNSDAEHILNATQGVPLAVTFAAEIYCETGSIDAVTEKVEGKKAIIDRMVNRYLLHTHTNLSDRYKLFGLAMLRRTDQTPTITVALGLTPEEAENRFSEEISYLYSCYGFMFTGRGILVFHREVRYFLRLWLLENRSLPEYAAINKRLLAAQESTLKALEGKRKYPGLKERFQNDEWVGAHLDLIEQQFWCDPVEGVMYILPFMIAAAIYRREINKEVAGIGQFFESHIGNPYFIWWKWAYQSLISETGHNLSSEELNGLECLEKLITQHDFIFPSFMPDYKEELQSTLWRRLSEAYIEKDYKKATEWYMKAHDLLKGEIEPIVKQGAELSEDAAQGYFHGQKPHNNKNLPKEVVGLQPDSAATYTERGNIYVTYELYDLAIADYTEAIELASTFAGAYYNRGFAHAALKKYEEAIADYTQAIKLDPQFASAYNNRGDIYATLKRSDLAFADYTRSLTLDSSLATSDYNRGFHYQKMYKLTHFSMNHSRGYGPKDIYSAWVWLWGNMGKHRVSQDIVIQLTNIAQIDAECYVAYLCRAIALALDDKLDEGLKELHKAISIEPEQPDAYFWKGMLCAYYYQGRYEMAVEAIKKALEMELVPLLLTPLYWLEKDMPDFFDRHIKSLLQW